MTEDTEQLINASAQQRGAVKVDPWDEYDPVANTLLVLIEAQNVLQRTFDATCEERDDGTYATDAELDAALDARTDAVVELLVAETAYWRESRSWRRLKDMDIHQKPKLGKKFRKL
jgi:hypothetical protein